MEILDASNLKMGTVSYKKIPFDFKSVTEEVVEHMRPKAADKKLALDFSVDATKTYEVTGDQEKIAQHVIRNLIDNSIRYTPRGSIHVTLARMNGVVRFSVKDTGVGITPEDKQKLFTEGGHGKDSIKVNVDSTGYGLFVAKQVVEGHDGKIWAESAGAGKGSEFIVELPA
jgi:signal transduction histidine kinase